MLQNGIAIHILKEVKQDEMKILKILKYFNDPGYLFFTILCLFSFGGKLKAQHTQISVDPGVTLKFREAKWVKMPTNENRFINGGEDATFALIQDTTTKLLIFSRFINLIGKNPDSVIAGAMRDAKKANGSIEKFGKKIILFYPTIYKKQKYYVYQIFITDDLHFVEVALLTKEKESVIQDRLRSDLNNRIQLDTPEELDRKEGYPLSSETFDSIIITRLAESWARYYTKYPSATENEKRDIEFDLRKVYTREFRDSFTYTKFYAIRRRLLAGDFSQKLWIDFYFKNQKFPELKYYRNFTNNDFDESEGVAIQTIENTVRIKLHWDSNAQIKIIDTVSKSTNNQVAYWLLISGKRFSNSQGQLFIFQLREKDSNWKIQSYKLDDTFNFKTIYDNSDNGLYFNHQYRGNAGLKNESKNVLVLHDEISQRFFLNNSFSDSSDFVSTKNPLLGNYEVSYLIWLRSLHNLNMVTTKYKNTLIHNYDNKLFSDSDMIDPQFRVYCLDPIFGDINENGKEDCYIAQISNGRVVHAQIVEFYERKIEEIPLDPNLLEKIESKKLSYQF